MRRLLFLFIVIASQIAYGQNYLISFEGIGASSNVDQVKVENLVSGLSITLNGNDRLHLTGSVGITQIYGSTNSAMRIHPNPVIDIAVIEILAPAAGEAVITVYEITGKKVMHIQTYLENSTEEFRISGVKKGMYLVNVVGNSYHISGKLQCYGKENGIVKLERVNNATEKSGVISLKKNYVQEANTIDMPYANGERLKFTAIAGNFSTVKTDVPAQSKSLTFNLISCSDADNYNYPIVEIGSQVWMAENLKTTKYRNGDLIGTTIPETLNIYSEFYPRYQWAVQGNEINTTTYGRLYSWYTVFDKRSICPTGWHIPSDAEWTSLSNFLGGENLAGGKLKETGTLHWSYPNTDASNETGFSGLPGGNRVQMGNFYSNGTLGFWWGQTQRETGFSWSRMISNSGGGFFRQGESHNVGLSVRCIWGPDSNLDPLIISTLSITNITSSSALSGGAITFDNGVDITSKGICWSTSPNPTIDLITKSNDGAGNDPFQSSLNGLSENTLYYVRAYATNSEGTIYGNESSFTTKFSNPTGIVYSTEMHYFHPAIEGSYPDEPYGGIRTPEKTLKAIDDGKMETWFGLWPDYSCIITINSDNTIDLTVDESFSRVVLSGDPKNSDNISHYDPETGIIYLYYNYEGQGGVRIFWEKFTPKYGTSATDFEGNIYKIVTIGTQTWMAENLKSTIYNDGVPIEHVSDESAWSELSSPGYCWYNNDSASYHNQYGVLYNWHAVNNGKICPIGWHVPTDAEWSILADFLGGPSVAGGKLKEFGTTHWREPNTGATNESGFLALPSSFRDGAGNAGDSNGAIGMWWSSSDLDANFAWGRFLYFNYGYLDRAGGSEKDTGAAVRCIKD